MGGKTPVDGKGSNNARGKGGAARRKKKSREKGTRNKRKRENKDAVQERMTNVVDPRTLRKPRTFDLKESVAPPYKTSEGRSFFSIKTKETKQVLRPDINVS